MDHRPSRFGGKDDRHPPARELRRVERPHRPPGGLAGKPFRHPAVKELEPLGPSRRFVSHRQAPRRPRPPPGRRGRNTSVRRGQRRRDGRQPRCGAGTPTRWPGPAAPRGRIPSRSGRPPAPARPSRRSPARPAGHGRRSARGPFVRRGKRRGDAVPFRVAGEVVRKGEKGFGRQVVRVGVIRLPAEEEANADPRVGPRNDPFDPAILHEDREGPGILEKQFSVFSAAGQQRGKDSRNGQFGERSGLGHRSSSRFHG